MSNQTTPITDDEIRSVLYRMAAHVSFFAEPRTPDPKASAFADALMSAVRPPVRKACACIPCSEPPSYVPYIAEPGPEKDNSIHHVEVILQTLKRLQSAGIYRIAGRQTISEFLVNSNY